MKISDHFKLNVTQYELDFIDVDLTQDCPLYIDPFLISILNNSWAIEADRTIKNFFNQFKVAMKLGDYDRARKLFVHMSEPKDNCLGISSKGTTNGKGLGELNTDLIVERIIESNAIEIGLVNNIEDIIIFVEDIDKDKLSDMCTNILRYKLIEYTQNQCTLWGIPLRKDETFPFWDEKDEVWCYTDAEQLFINGRSVLLIPKSIVSPLNIYQMSKYNWHFVITPERDAQLARRSKLVKQKKLKDGSVKYFLPKKVVQEDIQKKIENNEYSNIKDYIREYTLKNSHILDDFIKYAKEKSECLTNEQIIDFKKENIDADKVLDSLIFRLSNLESGRNTANEYHKLMTSILAIIFYPVLINPTVEKEIHDGRKRIDIVMTNNASKGFFHNMHEILKIFCPYIYIECKNYSDDVANPEIDQLSSRFSHQRGRFGILLCRGIKNEELFKKRCIDTYNDQRGLIIYLTDRDVISMLKHIKEDNYDGVWKILSEKQREIVVS